MENSQRICALGVSRGLGKACVDLLSVQNSQNQFFLSSRKISDSNSFKESLAHKTIFPADFSKLEGVESLASQISIFAPDRFFYFAGGGPYGKFAEKNWKDHEWSLNVNLLFPMKLCHKLLGFSKQSHLKQMIFVGSSIAEASADDNALSYSVGKHGLKGLVINLQNEFKELDIRLFSPSYFDSSLLPAHAEPRKQANKVHSLEHVSQLFVNWANDKNAFQQNYQIK